MSEEEQKHLQQSYYDLHEKYYKQKAEIERLNNKVEELMTLYTTEREVKEDYKSITEKLKKTNEEHRILNGELRKELQQKENIIKEVREYIEKNWISQKDADNYRFDDKELIIEISDIADLFDILDKGE